MKTNEMNEGFGGSEHSGATICEKIGSEVKGRVRSLLDDQKESAAGKLHSVAEAIRKSAEQLASSQEPSLAQYAGKAADTLDDLTDRLRRQDVEQMIEGAVHFIKRHPVAMFGGALAIGFIAIRIARSGLKGTASQTASAPSLH